MDTAHYSKYYQLDKLLSEIDKQNLFDKIYVLYNNCNYNELFKLAFEHNLDDLAEYLYIFYDTSYEISLLTTHRNKLHTDFATNVSVDAEISNNTELHICYMNPFNKEKAALIDRLNKLRKYSTMTRKGKEFWYSFNKKWIYNVVNVQ